MSKKAGTSKWYESVLKLLDGTIADQEYEALESKLLDNASAFDEYLEFIIIYSCMHEPLGLFDNILTFDPSEEPTVDMGILEKLAEYEKNVKAVEVERVKKPADRVLTEKERQAKIRAFLAEERKMEEQERLSDELARRKIRRREQRRRQRDQRAQLIAAKVRGYLRSAAIAAILMVVGYFVYAVMHPPEPAFVATLTEGADVKWADSRQPAEPGSQLEPGTMKLVEGYARITFNEGAGIVLEAPAEINLKNSNRAFLQLGKLSAEVPVQARGFKIDTPSASIIDLGTEFGIYVAEDGTSDVHVFKGRVSLLAGRFDNMVGRLFDTVEQVVEAGQARRVAKSGEQIEDIVLDRKSFVSKVAKSVEATPSGHISSVSPMGRILYFPFDMMNNKRVINSVSNAPIGRLIGLASVAMTGTDNGNFKNGVLKLNGGCVHIDSLKDQGSRDGYTFVMWVRREIDNLQKPTLQQIFSAKKEKSDEYNKGLFELELYVGDERTLNVFIDSEHIRKRHMDFSFQVDDIELSAGSWFHVAAVASPTLARIYVNGTPREKQWYMPKQTTEELLSAGSWDILVGSSNLSWNGSTPLIEEEFHGSIDDFAIYDKVLSQEEITELYLNPKENQRTQTD